MGQADLELVGRSEIDPIVSTLLLPKRANVWVRTHTMDKNSKKTRKTHKSVIQIVPMSTAGMKLQKPVIGSGVVTQALHPITWVAEAGI